MKLSSKIALIISGATLVCFLWLTFFILSYFAKQNDVFSNPQLFFSSHGSLLLLLLAILITVLVVAFAMWKLVTVEIAKPIEEIEKVTKTMSMGNLGVKVNFQSRDELGQLAVNINAISKNTASAFQGMANSLREAKEKGQDLARTVVQLEEAQRNTQRALEDLSREKSMLSESNAKDEALLSSIGDGVIAINNIGKTIFINDEAKRILGWEGVDVTGMYWTNLTAAADEKTGQIYPNDQQIIKRSLFTGTKITANCLFLKRDLTKVPVAVTASPIITGRNVNGVMIIFRDVTKEREVDRMKTEFISLASHQLRTPLSAIRWFTELLSDSTPGKLNSEQSELINNISQSTDRMVELVNGLLNISRIESGRIIIDPEPTDLVELTKSVIKELNNKITERSQQLIISAHDQLPKISIDPKLIRQVYVNLLTNAIKYSPKGGQIMIFISRKDDQIITQIHDNGYGIPEKDHAKVFQKFFRADNIVKIETDGTGLGLYLVKAIIDSSGGKIWFKSEENKGTTFWFSLPLAGSPERKGEVSINS